MNIKSESKLKLLLKKNYQPEKLNKAQIYPLLTNKYNDKKSKLISTNINSVNKRKVNTRKNYIRTTSAFLKRNYTNYLVKIAQQKSSENSSMVKLHQLNDLLYKLKKYDNELIIYNTHKLEGIKLLKDTLKQDEVKLKKLIDLQDIDLPDEKISIKNFNEIKLSKEDIEKKLHNLMAEKVKIEYSVKNEEEYYRTIEYMLENEQKRLSIIKKESYEIEEKIKNISKYQKIVNDNNKVNDKKEEDFHKLNQAITNDIKLVQKIKEKQDFNSEKIQKEIAEKEFIVKELEEKIKQLQTYKNNDMKLSKNDIKEQIENAKEYEKKRINDEKKCIEIIFCLYIIQKYLYEEKNFDKNRITQSKEYQLLYQLNNEEISFIKNDTKKNKKEKMYNIRYKGDEDLSHNENKRQFNSILSNTHKNKNMLSTTSMEETKYNTTAKNFFNNISMNKSYKSSRNLNYDSFKKIRGKTQLTFFQSISDINTFYSEDVNNLNELISKFNSIKITKEEIFDYISSLLSKLDFYGSQMNFIHNKEIILEQKRTNYEQKVKDIISKNFLFFEESTKNNEKCKQFYEKNKDFINQMKKDNKKLLMDTIIEKINHNDEISKNEEKINNKDENEIDEDNILFKYSKNLIMSIKNFFFTCSDLLKDIIISINNKNMLNSKKNNNNNLNKSDDNIDILLKDNNEEDKNNNNNKFIQAFKKISDFLKNKDIIIDDDYKLLLQYIKNLIKFCRENNEVLSKEDLDEINNNLLEKFYKQGEMRQKMDKIFIKRFLAKKNTNLNNIFIYFISLSEQVNENVKTIYDLIHSKENEIYLEEDNSEFKLKLNDEIFNKNIINQKKFSQASINNNESENIEGRTSRGKTIRRFTKVRSSRSVTVKKSNYLGINKFEELCADEEDNETVETQSTKKVIIKKKKRFKTIDDKVINKLYTPFLQKTVYLRQLNPNIPGIKQMTSTSSKAYHNIKKMIGEVDIISNQMKIYNNPHLDTNKLCDNTYNSLVKLIYENTEKNNKKRTTMNRFRFKLGNK